MRSGGQLDSANCALFVSILIIFLFLVSKKRGFNMQTTDAPTIPGLLSIENAKFHGMKLQIVDLVRITNS